MNTIKTFVIYPILILSAYQHFDFYAAEEVVGKVVTTVLGMNVEELVVASTYVKVALQAYRIGQEIREHSFPTIEEKAHAEEVAERYAFFTVENELQKCLIDNRCSSERNRFGQPIVCEDIARMLSMLGGNDEVNRMTSIYNQYRM